MTKTAEGPAYVYCYGIAADGESFYYDIGGSTTSHSLYRCPKGSVTANASLALTSEMVNLHYYRGYLYYKSGINLRQVKVGDLSGKTLAFSEYESYPQYNSVIEGEAGVLYYVTTGSSPSAVYKINESDLTIIERVPYTPLDTADMVMGFYNRNFRLGNDAIPSDGYAYMNRLRIDLRGMEVNSGVNDYNLLTHTGRCILDSGIAYGTALISSVYYLRKMQMDFEKPLYLIPLKRKGT